MLKNELIYTYEGQHSEEEELAYYNSVNELLHKKWRGFDLSGIPDEKFFTVKWENQLIEQNEIIKIIHKSLKCNKQ